MNSLLRGLHLFNLKINDLSATAGYSVGDIQSPVLFTAAVDSAGISGGTELSLSFLLKMTAG